MTKVSVSTKSSPANRNPTAADSRMTIQVRRSVSSRVGHTAFRSSEIVSWKNCIGLPLRNLPGEMILGPVPLAEDLATALPYFPVGFVTLATGAVFPELKTLSIVSSVLAACIVPLSAVAACQRYNHSGFRTLLSHCLYSTILVNTPAPTVLPPSLMANRKPASSAIG